MSIWASRCGVYSHKSPLEAPYLTPCVDFLAEESDLDRVPRGGAFDIATSSMSPLFRVSVWDDEEGSSATIFLDRRQMERLRDELVSLLGGEA